MTELFAKLGPIVWYKVVLWISILGLTQALKFITCIGVWKDFLKTLETSMKDNESISIRISCKRDIKESSAAWTFLNPGFSIQCFTVFNPNARKYGLEKTLDWDTFHNMYGSWWYQRIFSRKSRSKALNLSWWTSLSYRNQSFDLQSKSMDWFLYDRDLHHERVKHSD